MLCSENVELLSLNKYRCYTNVQVSSNIFITNIMQEVVVVCDLCKRSELNNANSLCTVIIKIARRLKTIFMSKALAGINKPM